MKGEIKLNFVKTVILLLKKMFRFAKDLNSRRSVKVTELLNLRFLLCF